MAKKRRQGGDKFLMDALGKSEYDNPGPSMDADAADIAFALSKITGRTKTGVVLNWRPAWLKKEGIAAFSFFFFEDRLAVDSFNRDRKELDALQDDLSPEQRKAVVSKTALCAANGIKYLAIGPDDELDGTTLAAKIGRTTFKKGGKMEARVAVGAGRQPAQQDDGFQEEELS